MNCFVLYKPQFIGFIRTLKCQLTGSPAQLNLKHKENLLAHRITKSRCRPSEIQNLEDMVTGLHDLSPTFLLLWWLHLGAESPQNAPDPTTGRPQREHPILTAPAGGPSGQAWTQALPPQWGQPTSPQNLRVGGGALQRKVRCLHQILDRLGEGPTADVQCVGHHSDSVASGRFSEHVRPGAPGGLNLYTPE